MWVQTNPLSFNHALTGPNNVYEEITEVPPITIPAFPGVWSVSYHARPSVKVDTTASLWVTTALFKNGKLIPGSEAMCGFKDSDVWAQDTIGQTFLHDFAIGDVLTLRAYRLGQDGSAAIFSNDAGRTTIAAHWVR
ncbi:hypothetical protein [Herbidospora cretacea]|uniref:hypothetical protein n=1 Tax=Herbidospora cretacea TaxID=28444 RepID=UPI0004C4335B|nr:hypothetical protein [Herbidospora cretacea]